MTMTNIAADIFAIFCLLIGLFFMFVGALGVLRLPDVYHRLHGATKATTLGLLGLLLAVVFHLGEMVVMIKAALTLLFAFVAVPVGSHILSRAAMFDRAHQWEGTLSDEHAADRLDAETDDASARRDSGSPAADDHTSRQQDQGNASYDYSKSSGQPTR